MSFLNRLGVGLYAAGGGNPSDLYDAQIKYKELKEKAEQWKSTQQMNLMNQGWQPIQKFPGGDPKDYQALDIPNVGQYFKPISTDDKATQLIKKAKAEAFQKMSPEEQAQYALHGSKKESAYAQPTWGQKNEVEAIKSAIKSGKFVYQNSMMGGKPSEQAIKTKDDALAVIQMKGLDPKQFADVLKIFDEVDPSELDSMNMNF